MVQLAIMNRFAKYFTHQAHPGPIVHLPRRVGRATAFPTVQNEVPQLFLQMFLKDLSPWLEWDLFLDRSIPGGLRSNLNSRKNRSRVCSCDRPGIFNPKRP